MAFAELSEKYLRYTGRNVTLKKINFWGAVGNLGVSDDWWV